MPRSLRLLAILGLGLALGGCAVRDTRPEGAWLAERDAWFQAHPNWEVSGRIALSDGERGGQLAFDWRAQGDQHEVQLRTVATGKRWRLLFNDWGAVLEGSDIGLLRGPDPDFLVEQAVGWPIPVRALVYWLRGLNGAPAEQAIFAADGTVASISAPPWVIEYQRFGQPQRGPLMPTRIQANSPPHQVRLVMRDWRWPDPGP